MEDPPEAVAPEPDAAEESEGSDDSEEEDEENVVLEIGEVNPTLDIGVWDRPVEDEAGDIEENIPNYF